MEAFPFNLIVCSKEKSDEAMSNTYLAPWLRIESHLSFVLFYTVMSKLQNAYEVGENRVVIDTHWLWPQPIIGEQFEKAKRETKYFEIQFLKEKYQIVVSNC